MKRFSVPAGVLLSVALLSACSTSGPDEPASSTPGSATSTTAAPQETLDYVALGDSYAAMGSRSAPTTGPEPCVRSTDNYPSLVLEEPNIEGIDVSCSSAVTEHILSDRTAPETIPAQVNSLKEDTDLVTLSIGGNDIYFGDIAACMYGAMDGSIPTTCESQRGAKTNEMLDLLPARLDAVHEEIRRRSPDARVIVTGYFPMLTASGECSEAGSISPTDKAWSVDLTARLNGIISDAASRHAAEFVLPENTEQHTACAEPKERWVDVSGVFSDSYPMHPTPAGQVAMSEAVVRAVRN
ncbi:GDSL-type esterase/lipase family protein [uncultured Corynebacterium sp.]|uniref:GDSL-type esterase/lipase family protein n=1 Tax=uncultured Corynebacterium sp. TaxID=159447 RepID=UPI002596EC0E|nr:SGNH/GDSL hydrolase family protein [uncultured Corynebacterium sp.]